MRFEPEFLVDALLTKSPGWARAGLANDDAAARQDAARELALVILDELRDDPPASDTAQSGLPV